MSDLPDENQKRYVAILSKKMDLGRSLNVLGHLSVGLSNLLEDSEGQYVDYQDMDGNVHPNLSHYPFIVLKADNSNKLRKVRDEAISRNIKFTDFTSSMIEGGSVEQQQRTRETKEADLEYLGVCLFGDTDVLREITKKFSLYK
ncbi:hypothetical protein BCT86_13475 [Vibrio breoganii]|uniref:DUF2000 domain-containing protein n=1 Tax=Vibrio breoganii TaxID=553239 RepID=A0AAN0XYP3_9VIBR|nr:DUF2000 domain-containing protein [Vibrio breoganii]ANO35085.1 hypothetical protein A6E01_18100 [Vibrio breoganii]PMG83340.1 hypothetical protein BCU83_05045 [Vibrio breoganii]PMK45225.1 hypothetical protein BCU00_00835 [Vibrio breoganii]PML05207.1 hypothetical protein BCT86_13475 [Vibrio breoganii]PMO27877.1 hypothetical protein BCT12_08185 [Vibrio breoganii]